MAFPCHAPALRRDAERPVREEAARLALEVQSLKVRGAVSAAELLHAPQAS